MIQPWIEEAVRVAGDAAEAHISDRAHTFDREPTGWRVCRCGEIDKDGSHRTREVVKALYYAGFLQPQRWSNSLPNTPRSQASAQADFA